MFNQSNNKTGTAIKKQEEYSLSELYDNCASYLYSYILKIVPDKIEAENILASIFIQFSKIKEKDKPGSPIIWLSNTARDESINSILAHSNNTAYRKVLDDFSLFEKTILSLMHLRGFTVPHVAALLQLPEKVIENKLEVSFKKLQQNNFSFSLDINTNDNFMETQYLRNMLTAYISSSVLFTANNNLPTERQSVIR